MAFDPPGKVTVPDERAKSSSDAVPVEALQATVAESAITRPDSFTVNSASSPSSTGPFGPLTDSQAKSLSLSVRYTG